MKHKIKRANTARPHIVIYGSPRTVVVDALMDYWDELAWHYKNGSK